MGLEGKFLHGCRDDNHLAGIEIDRLCALRHDGPFQLLVATILSAQTTDERVNLVTPALFARYPGPHELAAADPGEVEELIHSTGFFRAKTRSLVGMATAVVERYGGEVPSALDDLVTLLDPRFIEVVGDFNVRGNIKTVVTARHGQKGWSPNGVSPRDHD